MSPGGKKNNRGPGNQQQQEAGAAWSPLAFCHKDDGQDGDPAEASDPTRQPTDLFSTSINHFFSPLLYHYPIVKLGKDHSELPQGRSGHNGLRFICIAAGCCVLATAAVLVPCCAPSFFCFVFQCIESLVQCIGQCFSHLPGEKPCQPSFKGLFGSRLGAVFFFCQRP